MNRKTRSVADGMLNIWIQAYFVKGHSPIFGGNATGHVKTKNRKYDTRYMMFRP